MYRVVFTYLLLGYISSITQSIMGGYDVKIEVVPFHIGYGDRCGGVLLQKTWAVTTAHCGTDVKFIRIGSNKQDKGAIVQIKAHKVHPQFQKRHEFDFDIQLLNLKNPIHFYTKVSSIPILKNHMKHEHSILVSGWGYEKEWGNYNPILQQVKLNTIPMDKCQSVNAPCYNHTLTSRMFCAAGDKGKDACQGDSGGPAVSPEGYLMGLSSFGYGCGRVPGVYTNLSHRGIRRWIYKHAGV